jgi:hypothetical protein
MGSELIRYEDAIPVLAETVTEFAGAVLNPLFGMGKLAAKVLAMRVESKRLKLEETRGRWEHQERMQAVRMQAVRLQARALDQHSSRLHAANMKAIQVVERPKPKPVPSPRTSAIAKPAPGRTPTQVRAVLQRQLGQAYADEQERVRLHVLRQEKKVADRLARAQRLLDFEELRTLHTESRQTADHAYRLMDQARKAENQLWSSIKQTYQARDTSGTQGSYRAQYTQTANALHQDKDMVQLPHAVQA